MLKRLDQAFFDAVAREARRSPRLRRNLNVLQPGTYVRPHRNLRCDPAAAFECLVVLQGAIGLLLLDGSGQVRGQERLNAATGLRGIEIADGQFHTLVALQPDSVMLEVKQSPYSPATDKDSLPRVPAEGSAEADQLVRSWSARFG
ncbi:MAG: cupin fold metalloprotein, WbuC family [Cyanobacteria bacterium]|nr:cupin fold metalloprotein, WbuC family [Cyanobacteria bacterium bin.51]